MMLLLLMLLLTLLSAQIARSAVLTSFNCDASNSTGFILDGRVFDGGTEQMPAFRIEALGGCPSVTVRNMRLFDAYLVISVKPEGQPTHIDVDGVSCSATKPLGVAVKPRCVSIELFGAAPQDPNAGHRIRDNITIRNVHNFIAASAGGSESAHAVEVTHGKVIGCKLFLLENITLRRAGGILATGVRIDIGAERVDNFTVSGITVHAERFFLASEVGTANGIVITGIIDANTTVFRDFRVTAANCRTGPMHLRGIFITDTITVRKRFTVRGVTMQLDNFSSTASNGLNVFGTFLYRLSSASSDGRPITSQSVNLENSVVTFRNCSSRAWTVLTHYMTTGQYSLSSSTTVSFANNSIQMVNGTSLTSMMLFVVYFHVGVQFTCGTLLFDSNSILLSGVAVQMNGAAPATTSLFACVVRTVEKLQGFIALRFVGNQVLFDEGEAVPAARVGHAEARLKPFIVYADQGLADVSSVEIRNNAISGASSTLRQSATIVGASAIALCYITGMNSVTAFAMNGNSITNLSTQPQSTVDGVVRVMWFNAGLWDTGSFLFDNNSISHVTNSPFDGAAARFYLLYFGSYVESIDLMQITNSSISDIGSGVPTSTGAVLEIRGLHFGYNCYKVGILRIEGLHLERITAAGEVHVNVLLAGELSVIGELIVARNVISSVFAITSGVSIVRVSYLGTIIATSLVAENSIVNLHVCCSGTSTTAVLFITRAIDADPSTAVTKVANNIISNSSVFMGTVAVFIAWAGATCTAVNISVINNTIALLQLLHSSKTGSTYVSTVNLWRPSNVKIEGLQNASLHVVNNTVAAQVVSPSSAAAVVASSIIVVTAVLDNEPLFSSTLLTANTVRVDSVNIKNSSNSGGQTTVAISFIAHSATDVSHDGFSCVLDSNSVASTSTQGNTDFTTVSFVRLGSDAHLMANVTLLRNKFFSNNRMMSNVTSPSIISVANISTSFSRNSTWPTRFFISGTSSSPSSTVLSLPATTATSTTASSPLKHLNNTEWTFVDCSQFPARALRHFRTSYERFTRRTSYDCSLNLTRSATATISDVDSASFSHTVSPDRTTSQSLSLSLSEPSITDPTASPRNFSQSQTASRSGTKQIPPAARIRVDAATPKAVPAAVFAVGAFAGGAAAASFALASLRTSRLLSMANCAGEPDPDVPLELSPTTLAIGMPEHPDYPSNYLQAAYARRVGGIVGNLALVAGAGLLLVAACGIFMMIKNERRQMQVEEQEKRKKEKKRVKRQQEPQQQTADKSEDEDLGEPITFLNACQTLRFPGRLIGVAMLLGAASTELSMNVLLWSHFDTSAVWLLVSIVSLALTCIVLPFAMHTIGSIAEDNERVIEMQTNNKRDWGAVRVAWTWLMEADYEWLESDFVQRYGNIFHNVGAFPKWEFYDYSITSVVGLMAGTSSSACKTRTCCITLSAVASAACLLHTALLLLFSPHLVRFETLFQRLLAFGSLVAGALNLAVLLVADSTEEAVEELGPLLSGLAILNVCTFVLGIIGAAVVSLKSVVRALQRKCPGIFGRPPLPQILAEREELLLKMKKEERRSKKNKMQETPQQQQQQQSSEATDSPLLSSTQRRRTSAGATRRSKKRQQESQQEQQQQQQEMQTIPSAANDCEDDEEQEQVEEEQVRPPDPTLQHLFDAAPSELIVSPRAYSDDEDDDVADEQADNRAHQQEQRQQEELDGEEMSPAEMRRLLGVRKQPKVRSNSKIKLDEI